jgi:hypothetical protein
MRGHLRKLICQDIASPLDIPGPHEAIWPPDPCRNQPVQFPDAISHEKLTAKNFTTIQLLDFILTAVFFPVWGDQGKKRQQLGKPSGPISTCMNA